MHEGTSCGQVPYLLHHLMPPGSAVWDDGCSKAQERISIANPEKHLLVPPSSPQTSKEKSFQAYCQRESFQVCLACMEDWSSIPFNAGLSRNLSLSKTYLRKTPRLKTVGPGVGLGGKQWFSHFPSFCFMGVTELSSTPYPGNYRMTSPAPF